MSWLYYVIFGLVVFLLAFLIYVIIYDRYTKKINRVLQRKEKPGSYGSLDKKFYIVLISSIIILIGIFLTIYFITNKNFNYTIPFYENIEDFDIEQFEKDIIKKMKPKDDFVALYDDFYIYTDNEGKVYDIKLSLIVKKGEKYYLLRGTFDDERYAINYNGGDVTFLSDIIENYTKLSRYRNTFSRIDFSNIWNTVNVEENNKDDLQFILSLKQTHYYASEYYLGKEIKSDGTIENYDKPISGFLGTFKISKIEQYEGYKQFTTVDYYLLIP